MATEVREYTRVLKIVQPGNYIFAADPAQGVFDVLGRRPYLEKAIDESFRSNHPDLRVSFLHKYERADQVEEGAERYCWYPYHVLKNYPDGADFNSLVYRSTRPGIITVDREYYRFACRLEHLGIHLKTVDIVLKDNARYKDNQDRDGILELKECEPEYDDIPVSEISWQGSLKFRGNNLGPLIREALKSMNSAITLGNIPIWSWQLSN